MKLRKSSPATGCSYLNTVTLCAIAFTLGQLLPISNQSPSGNSLLFLSPEVQNDELAVALPTAATNDGWSNIQFFYGLKKHLTVPAKDLDKKWFSQVRQDRVIAGLLRNKTNGFFIDLAANDAIHLSNTYALEQNLDWNGLCIEANPAYWKRLAYRKCQVVGAAVGAERNQELTFAFRAEYGGFTAPKGKMDVETVATVPLLEIFERFKVPRHIDYLSLDVEGAESAILMQFPLDKYRIDILTVERPKKNARSYLASYGYKEAAHLGVIGESLFVHESVIETLDWESLKYQGCDQGIRDFECTRPLPDFQK